MGNSFGNIFRLTTFGESHGAAIGGVIDGVPAGCRIDAELIQDELRKRRPGAGPLGTTRREPDEVELLSGLMEGVTTGTPIGFIIRNTNQRSNDYDAMRHLFRPSHADYTYQVKYGVRDYRGGGRTSARETACRVVGGAVAQQILAEFGITIDAYASRIGPLQLPADSARLEALTAELRAAGDTVGGVVSCTINGVPAGVGEPLFDKLQARLAAAMLSVPAAKGFEYGDGFALAAMRGSEANDRFIPSPEGGITTVTNHSGGIQGGISNGQPITMRVAFKPVATLMRPQETVDDCGNPATLQPRGRHDVCVVPRAVPVVKAMAALVVLDALLAQRLSRI